MSVLERARSSGNPQNVSTLPLRLHHHAIPVKDSEVTRKFYEDVLGIPLAMTWVEEVPAEALEWAVSVGRKGDMIRFCHTFYMMADGSALAFFGFDDPEVYEKLKMEKIPAYYHTAFAVTAEQLFQTKARLETAGYAVNFMEHGYCKSLYFDDPNGQHLEFTCDPEDFPEIAEWQKKTARAALDRWMSGDTTTNNDIRGNH